MTREGIDLTLSLQTSIVTSRSPLSEVHVEARSLYVHIPFCFHKCHYCDFYSFVDRQDRQEAFIGALIKELGALAPHAASPLRTIFVGGGTPTLLQPALWSRLLESLHESFNLTNPDLEFSVECNPETASPELMGVLADGGVNRLSIGAQSFDPAHLETLERWHEPKSVGRALRLAHEAGIERQSLDLIFGIPGQTLDDWRQDLETALALEPPIEHLSCYGLTYEPNTAMTRRLRAGEFQRCDNELEAEMYELTVDLAARAGLARYEISNFARGGAECRHNLAYWRSDDWLAAGPSASAHVGGHRWKNLPRLSDWMESVQRTNGFAPIIDHEPPDVGRAERERIMMGLRLTEGVAPNPMLAREAQRLAKQGYLTDDPERWRLTERGFLMADYVISELLNPLT